MSYSRIDLTVLPIHYVVVVVVVVVIGCQIPRQVKFGAVSNLVTDNCRSLKGKKHAFLTCIFLEP